MVVQARILYCSFYRERSTDRHNRKVRKVLEKEAEKRAQGESVGGLGMQAKMRFRSQASKQASKEVCLWKSIMRQEERAGRQSLTVRGPLLAA